MKIGIIDADLLDKGTRHPNLALMKISGYYKKENEVILLDSYDDIPNYDKVFISKVFDFTKTPDLSVYDNIEIGGTGFFGIEAKDLPYEIEHHMPDYHLYDKYIENEIARGVRPSKFNDYILNYKTEVKDSEFVFCSVRGNKMDVNVPLRILKETLTKAGLPTDMHIHDLRHIAATLMVESTNGDIEGVSKVLGHSDSRVLSKTYNNMRKENKKNIIENNIVLEII